MRARAGILRLGPVSASDLEAVGKLKIQRRGLRRGSLPAAVGVPAVGDLEEQPDAERSSRLKGPGFRAQADPQLRLSGRRK